MYLDKIKEWAVYNLKSVKLFFFVIAPGILLFIWLYYPKGSNEFGDLIKSLSIFDLLFAYCLSLFSLLMLFIFFTFLFSLRGIASLTFIFWRVFLKWQKKRIFNSPIFDKIKDLGFGSDGDILKGIYQGYPFELSYQDGYSPFSYSYDKDGWQSESLDFSKEEAIVIKAFFLQTDEKNTKIAPFKRNGLVNSFYLEWKKGEIIVRNHIGPYNWLNSKVLLKRMDLMVSFLKSYKLAPARRI